jgi:predicted nucleic acid-binding protein
MKNRKAFWDTNILLYWIEQDETQVEQVKELVDWQKNQAIDAVTSAFSLAELLVRPISQGEAEAARRYSEIVEKMGCIQFGSQEALAYACIKADYPDMKAPDCIQLACAVSQGVDFFFTSDRKLNRYKIDGIGEIVYLKHWFEQRRK